MSKLFACAIRDDAVQAFNRPFFVPSLGLAVRSFEDEARRNSPDNPMLNHAKDFSLYHLGFFDDVLGSFESLDIPLRLCDAVSVTFTEP